MIGSVLRIRYELTQLLGEGPIFTTYAARDRVYGREVTIRLVKAPFATERAFLDRVRQVITRTHSVNHPSVERLAELDEDEGTPFLVGDISRGATLAERIRKLAPYSVPVSVAMTVSVLEGLSAIHQAGLVHGDVSGTNVVIQPDGTARLQLTSMWESYSASATAGSVVLPSMAPYLAPEVSNGAMPTPASDVYSVGILLFQLLTGRQPYSGETPVSLAMKHATATTPNVRSINPSVPTALDEVVKRAMSKDPAQRYASASEMLADLRVIEDAVRFGRPLTWPLKTAAPAPGPAPVAPKMSAVRTEPKTKEAKPEREPGDVPVWMVVTFTSALVVAVVMLLLWFGFNLTTPRLVTVPQIKGLSMSEAKSMLSSLKLEPHIASRQTSERYPADVILSVNPEPGRKVREGGVVSLSVSSGSRYVVVPDLRGRTLDEAKSMLSSLNLQLDERIEQVRSFNAEKGTIIKQLPQPRTKVERRARIRVSVSSGREVAPAKPTTADQYIYTLQIRLSRITEAVQLRVDISDAQGIRTIYENRHFPDETVEVKTEGYGEEAKFLIYYDGELATEVKKQADERAPADSQNAEASPLNNGEDQD